MRVRRDSSITAASCTGADFLIGPDILWPLALLARAAARFEVYKLRQAVLGFLVQPAKAAEGKDNARKAAGRQG